MLEEIIMKQIILKILTFPLVGGLNSPPTSCACCLLQHIHNPCGSNVLTGEEIGYCQNQLGIIAPSNITEYGLIKTCQNCVLSFFHRGAQQRGASQDHHCLSQGALQVLSWLIWVFADVLFSIIVRIPSLKEVLVDFLHPREFFLSMASHASQATGGGGRFKPEQSAPQAIHLWPCTIGDFSTWSSSQMLLNGALINVYFSELVLAQLGVDLE